MHIADHLMYSITISLYHIYDQKCITGSNYAGHWVYIKIIV